jgi:hypothetical protein
MTSYLFYKKNGAGIMHSCKQSLREVHHDDTTKSSDAGIINVKFKPTTGK